MKNLKLAQIPRFDEDDEEEELIDFEDLAKNLSPRAQKTSAEGDGWLTDESEEGQLAIDVYEKPAAFVIKATIAGVKPEDIDISIENDMVTIRGQRRLEETVSDDDYLFRECYWGDFSRSIILPLPVKSDQVEAQLKNGVLTVTLPKAKPTNKIAIKLEE